MPTANQRAPGHAMSAIALLGVVLAACVAPIPAADTRYRAASQDSRVQFIVLHYTELDFAASLKRLTTADVSSHYLVRAQPPEVYRLVAEDRRAWHAGPSYWAGYTHLNASSIGIEIVNPGNAAAADGSYAEYPPAQIERVIALVRDVERRHAVRPDRVLGHSDVQPLGKQDPGPRFPWYRLAQAGLIVWPDPALVAAARERYAAAPPPVAWFQERLAAHGFDAPRHGELDPATRTMLAAFQMKYRPEKYDGLPDADTAALLDVCTRPGGWQLRGADGQWRAWTAR